MDAQKLNQQLQQSSDIDHLFIFLLYKWTHSLDEHRLTEKSELAYDDTIFLGKNAKTLILELDSALAGELQIRYQKITGAVLC